MTDQFAIPEVLKDKAIAWHGVWPAAPHGHTIAIAIAEGRENSTYWFIRDGEIVGRIVRRAGLWHMYVGPAVAGGWYLGAEGDAAVALARIAKAAERRRAAAGAASAGPAPEPEPSWLPGLRNGMWDPVSKAFDANGLPHGTENVTNVSAAATAYAATYLRPLHAELAEAKREIDALRGSLRARDARIARQDEEIDAFGAEIATNASTLSRQAAEIDALRKWITKQAAANAWAKATAPRPEHLPASATAEAYLGGAGPASAREESAPSPEMQEVPIPKAREGDAVAIEGEIVEVHENGFTIRRRSGHTFVVVGLHGKHHDAGLTVTRPATSPVSSLPTNQHAVIRCMAMRGTTVRDAREIVAELRYDCWYGTDRYAYRPQDIVRVIAVLSPGDGQEG